MADLKPHPPHATMLERFLADLGDARDVSPASRRALEAFVRGAPTERLGAAWSGTSGARVDSLRAEAFAVDAAYRATRWPELVAAERRRWVRLRRRALELAGVTGLGPQDLEHVACGAPDWTDGPGAVVRRWLARGQTRGLLLVGAVGTGKTCAAVLALAEGWSRLAAGGPAGRFATAQELAHGPFHPWSRDLDGRRAILQAPVLVLDDLGAEDGNDFGAALGEILDARVGRPTIVTSNLAPPAIAARYGDRILDRLRERFAVASFSGPSRRRAAPGWETFAEGDHA